MRFVLTPLSGHVVVLGDVILDSFLYGAAERISPEAPIPVVRLARRTSMAGGAGNVAQNLLSLGGAATLIGLVGEDAAAGELELLLGSGARLVRSSRRSTSIKFRVIAARQQIVRVDEEDVTPAWAEEGAALIAALRDALKVARVLVLSDYGKGVLTPEVCAAAIALAAEAGVPCLVDPKGCDYARYAGADILTPNAAELAEVTAMPVAADAEAEAAARVLLARHSVGCVLATRSEKGMMLVRRDGPAVLASATAREVFDVSGAGDTVIATLALSLASGLDILEAMRLANAAAGVVVGKLGTATCTAIELRQALRGMESEDKVLPRDGEVLPRDAAVRLVRGWQAAGLQVGFANGCFDVLHAGHALMLREARRKCDRLVVALNEDDSVRRLKGPSRPLNTLADRAAVIGALAAVDAVTGFDEDTPLEAILALRPDRLFKGADYTLQQVVGASDVASWGGQTILLELLPGRSTTSLVERARETT
jgi:D-beta-D-heptose 7-phosphate kinase/D-beta-D-heptose 1-phosphate adenosyltransferase